MEGLATLEWAADPTDPRRLVRDPEVVRPRVELFLDSLIAGLGRDDWSTYADAIYAPTAEVLRAGVRSARELNERALAMVSMLIPLVSMEHDRDELLVALFRTMQMLSGGLIAGHHQQLVDELQRLNEVKSLFMRLTSHELRSPLTVTRGYASMLAGGDLGDLPPQVSGAASYIMGASDAALSLIDGLAEVARLDQGADVLKMATVQLRSVVEEAVRAVQREAEAKDVSIEQQVDGDAVLHVDPDRCVIAVRNLLANAVKYGDTGAVVRLRASFDGDGCVEITVSDDGPGIGGDELDMVFERYYRAQSGRTAEVPGSGLGLYIVRRIAELHGGEVRVSSAPGRGSRFTLSLPATSAR